MVDPIKDDFQHHAYAWRNPHVLQPSQRRRVFIMNRESRSNSNPTSINPCPWPAARPPGVRPVGGRHSAATPWEPPEAARCGAAIGPTIGLLEESKHPEGWDADGGARSVHPAATPDPGGNRPRATHDGRARPMGWDGAATGVGGEPDFDRLGEAVHAQARDLFDRIAGCLERLADGIDAIAAHSRLSSPPMTVEQVAEYARWKNRSTVYRWVREGKLRPLADKARPLLFDQSEVRRALGQVRGIGS